jgi:transcriptional regulator with XRE-family HTH domain
MGIQEGLKNLRQEKGLSLRKLAELTGISRVTLNDIERGKQKQGPRLETLKTIGEKADYDIHLLAHYAFDIPKPEQFGELDELLQNLCDRVMGLNEEDRKNVLTYVKMLTRMRKEEGGDAKDHNQDTQSGFG